MLEVAVLYPKGSSRSFPLSGSVCIYRGVAEMVLNGRRAAGSFDSGAEGVQRLVGLPPLRWPLQGGRERRDSGGPWLPKRMARPVGKWFRRIRLWQV